MKTYESNRGTAWWSNDSVYYDSCRTLCGDGVFAKPLAVLMQAPQEALMLTSVYVRICGEVFSLSLLITFFLPYSEGWETVGLPYICYGCLRGKCRR